MSAKPGVLDRSRPPAPGAVPAFDFPPFEATRLDNGLQILAARTPRVPLLSLQILAPAGGQYDSVEHPGLSSLHGGLLDEGTARRTSLEIARLVEGLGGSAGSGAGWNMAFAELFMLSEHLASGLDLLADMVRAPAFPQNEIDRLRQERRAELLRRKVDPAALAQRFFASAVYGDTVYGLPLIGTEESLERIDREQLESFYRRHVQPGGSTVIAVGDLDAKTMIDRVSEAFGDWPVSAAPKPPTIEPPAIESPRVHIVDRPESAQTQLHLGHASIPRQHPDFARLLLLNTIFGGKFTSRINLNLREEHGFTYGAHSFFGRRRGPGPFVIRAAVATEVAGAAVEQLSIELRRIREQPVTADELKETQDYLVGVFPYTLQTIDDMTKRLEAIAVFDLPLDYYDSYPAVLADIECDELLETASTHFHPDRLAIVAVGPAEDLEPQLEGFGPVTVHQP